MDGFVVTTLLTAEQMRTAEKAAIDSGEVTGLELMERAGAGVVEAMFDTWPELAGAAHCALVLCGPGNNGGDGFVVARLLHRRGWQVQLFLYGDPARLPPDARTNHGRWSALGPTHDLAPPDALQALEAPEVVFDGLFGTGLTRPVEGRLADVLNSVEGLRAGHGARVVAIDMPSGMCSDSGRHLGPFARADLTVSFHRAKLGHYLDRGPEQSGRLVVKGIGLDEGAVRADRACVVTLAEPDPGALLKQSSAHKYSHGHALVLSGGAGRTRCGPAGGAGGVEGWGRAGDAGGASLGAARGGNADHRGDAASGGRW